MSQENVEVVQARRCSPEKWRSPNAMRRALRSAGSYCLTFRMEGPTWDEPLRPRSRPPAQASVEQASDQASGEQAPNQASGEQAPNQASGEQAPNQASLEQALELLHKDFGAVHEELREMRREFTAVVTGELHGVRSDFASLQDRLVKIGLGLVWLLFIATRVGRPRKKRRRFAARAAR
jgi:hypothetical protein